MSVGAPGAAEAGTPPAGFAVAQPSSWRVFTASSLASEAPAVRLCGGHEEQASHPRRSRHRRPDHRGGRRLLRLRRGLSQRFQGHFWLVAHPADRVGLHQRTGSAPTASNPPGDIPDNQVIGKSVRDSVERYVFFHYGRQVVLTLTGPTGADNVDPWRIVSDSLRWQ